MAVNIDPPFTKTPKQSWGTLTTANTAKDGTGTVVLIATAGADGDFIEDIRALPLGTNTASVLRIFCNNGGTNATATNNALWYEVSLPSTTLSEVAGQTATIITLNRALQATYRLYATIGTTVAAGWQVTAGAGSYTA